MTIEKTIIYMTFTEALEKYLQARDVSRGMLAGWKDAPEEMRGGRRANGRDNRKRMK